MSQKLTNKLTTAEAPVWLTVIMVCGIIILLGGIFAFTQKYEIRAVESDASFIPKANLERTNLETTPRSYDSTSNKSQVTSGKVSAYIGAMPSTKNRKLLDIEWTCSHPTQTPTGLVVPGNWTGAEGTRTINIPSTDTEFTVTCTVGKETATSSYTVTGLPSAQY